MDLQFISNEKLRERIGDALSYILVLDANARQSNEIVFKFETYRVIILYAHSIIEALLHEAYGKLEEEIERVEYKDPSSLSKNFTHKEFKDGEVVIAVRKSVVKTEREIGFFELVQFLEDKILKPETVERMKKLNDLRNSFHLKKVDSILCKEADVDEALQLLELTLARIPGFVGK